MYPAARPRTRASMCGLRSTVASPSFVEGVDSSERAIHSGSRSGSTVTGASLSLEKDILHNTRSLEAAHTASGNMSFFNRVLSYLANELLVNRLANRRVICGETTGSHCCSTHVLLTTSVSLSVVQHHFPEDCREDRRARVGVSPSMCARASRSP